MLKTFQQFLNSYLDIRVDKTSILIWYGNNFSKDPHENIEINKILMLSKAIFGAFCYISNILAYDFWKLKTPPDSYQFYYSRGSCFALG